MSTKRTGLVACLCLALLQCSRVHGLRPLRNLRDHPEEVTSLPLKKVRRVKTLGWWEWGRQLIEGETKLTGSAREDFVSPVQVGDQTFNVIMDTGSGDFAVAGTSAGSSCQTVLSSAVPCTAGAVPLQAYGSGNWSGAACNNGGGTVQVSIASRSAGKPFFSRMDSENNMLNCPAEIANTEPSEGIMGMGMYALLPNQQYRNDNIFDSIVKTSGIDNVFAMQCCGWDTAFDMGTLTLGGTDPGVYKGSISWTPLTSTDYVYWCVEIESFSMGSTSAQSAASRRLFSKQKQPQQAFGSYGGDQQLAGDGTSVGTCPAIVDSGTSALTLEPSYYALVQQTLGSEITAGQVVPASQLDSLPPMILTLKGGVTLTITARRYMQPASTDGTGDRGYALLVEQNQPLGDGSGPQNIIGQVVMEGYYTVFDKGNSRVGFAEIDCPGSAGKIDGDPSGKSSGSSGSTIIVIAIAVAGAVGVLLCVFLVSGGSEKRRRRRDEDGQMVQLGQPLVQNPHDYRQL